MNEKLNKSLEEISAKADEILKSLQDSGETIEKGKADKTPAEGAVSESQQAAKNKNGDDAEEGDAAADKDAVARGAESIAKSEDGANDEENKKDNEDDIPEDEEIEKSMCKDCGKETCECTKKSLADLLEDSDTIQKSIDASDFLDEFTRLNAQAFESLRGDVSKSLGAQDKVQETLAKSLNAVLSTQQHIVKSQASLVKSLQELTDRLDRVEKTPVGRKSVDNIQVVEKSFAHSAGVAGEGSNTLSKSETLAKMTDMVMKGVRGISVQDVIDFESTGRLNPNVQAIVSQN